MPVSINTVVTCASLTDGSSVTLVTAFPDRRHQDPRQPILSANISKDLKDNPPSTMGSMICRILKHATGFVEAPNNAGLSENLFHIFEQSIAYRVGGPR